MTYLQLFWPLERFLAENWRKKNFWATPTFFVVDLALECNVFNVFPTLDTLFGIDASKYTAAYVSDCIESVIRVIG